MFKSKAQTLVNTVNTVGVMGKGIALGFKRRFPEMFEDYAARCRQHLLKLGEPYVWKGPDSGPWILNFPTKEHWRSVANLASIVDGLEYLEDHFREWGIESLAVPPLGCGEGGLEWRVVGPTLFRHLSRLGIPVELYAPFGTPHEELQPNYLAQLTLVDEIESVPASRIPAAWIALVATLDRISQERYHHPIGRVAFQKLAYFATGAGIPTGLEYERGSYGPYSSQVKPLISRLKNNGLITEEPLGKMLRIKVGSTYADATAAYEAELREWSPTIERLADLFMRLNTHKAEVAATADFAARELMTRNGKVPTENEVLEEVQRWKVRRRPPLSDSEIAGAIRMLGILGWLKIEPSESLPIEEPELIDV